MTSSVPPTLKTRPWASKILEEIDEGVDEIVHMAEAVALRPVAENGDRLAPHRVPDEAWDHHT